MPTSKKLKERALFINETLKVMFPKAQMILKYSNNWELLVAVALSAQCTDIQVNKVTEKLFKKYPRLGDYIVADLKEFEQDIFSTGFYRNKAKNILAAAHYIHDVHGGMIPRSVEELVLVPGVGKKTANVVLGNAYGIVEGIAVDTHVKRLAIKYGLTKASDPLKIEQDLMKLLPQEEWFMFTYRLIDYGRAYCVARNHDHAQCPLTIAIKEYEQD